MAINQFTAKTILDRIDKNLIPEPNSGCWLWMGACMGNGYGAIRVGTKVTTVHRVMYMSRYGNVPEGMELDHKCRVRCCANPDHLEAVTHAENCRRGESKATPQSIAATIAAKKAITHCPYGHEYSVMNTVIYHGSRNCRTCIQLRNRRIKPAN